MKSILLSAGSLLLFAACKSNLPEQKSETVTIIETSQWLNPINNLRIEPETFTFSTEKDKVIKLETGSSLFIPAYSFVDREGNPIVGEIKLNFNEYHSFGEVMLSGLPMVYDSAGVDQQMITGGMFKIEAFQHGEELYLAKDKRIKVDISSKTGVERMNFYQLDEQNGDWTYKQSGTGVKEKRNFFAENSSTKAKETNNFTLLDIQLKTDHLPALKGKTIVAWKTTEPIANDVKSRLKFSHVGTELFETKRGNNYRLVLTKTTKEETEKIELNVEPYFIEDALADSKKVQTDFEENTKEVENYINRVANNEVVRTIEIAKMGVYNWDYLYHRSNSKKMECYLSFPENTNTNFVNIFTICPEDNAVVRLNFTDKGNYVYDPTRRNCLIAITNDNRVYYVPNSEFTKQLTKNYLNFKFTKSEVVLNSPSNFDKHLHEFI